MKKKFPIKYVIFDRKHDIAIEGLEDSGSLVKFTDNETNEDNFGLRNTDGMETQIDIDNYDVARITDFKVEVLSITKNGMNGMGVPHKIANSEVNRFKELAFTLKEIGKLGKTLTKEEFEKVMEDLKVSIDEENNKNIMEDQSEKV